MQDKYMQLFENMADELLKVTQDFRNKYYAMKEAAINLEIDLLKAKLDAERKVNENAIKKIEEENNARSI
jgi:hypothetical protein